MKPAILPLLFAGLLLGGCATTTSVDLNAKAIEGKTYSFIAPNRAITPGKNEAHGFNPMIQAGIEKELSRRGLVKVESAGDVTVGYMIVVRSGTATSAMSEYFGHGPEAQALLQQAHKRANSLVKEMEKDRMIDSKRFKAAALLVDLVDTKTGRLIFRQSALRPLNAAPTDETRRENIDAALAEIFGKLR